MNDQDRHIRGLRPLAAPKNNPSPRGPASAPDGIPLASGTRIWVDRGPARRPGVVLTSSRRAAMIRYRPTEGSGTAVDTVATALLALRDEPDSYVDSDGAGPRPASLVHREPPS